MNWSMKATVVVGVLGLHGLAGPATAPLGGVPSGAVSGVEVAEAAIIAATVGVPIECRRCYADPIFAPSTGDYYVRHYLSGASCSEEEEYLVAEKRRDGDSSDTQLKLVAVQVGIPPDAELRDPNWRNDNCSRCGGTSDCHYEYEWTSMGCHLPCTGEEEPEVSWRRSQELRGLVRTASASGIVDMMSGSAAVVFNPKQKTLEVMGGCNNSTLVDVIRLDRAMVRMIEAELLTM